MVTGSDSQTSPVTEALRADGFAVTSAQSEVSLPADAQVVVASAAIKPDNPELLTAVERGLPILTYAEALGTCMADRTGIAIAGTHGKSTTAAMLGHALIQAGLDPTVIVGATCRQLGEKASQQPVSVDEDSRNPSPQPSPRGRGSGSVALQPSSAERVNVGASGTGFRMGAERICAGALGGAPGALVVEACEFNRSFHSLTPTVASISAVEADHLDVYGSLDAVVEAFAQFAQLLPPEDKGGKLFIAHEGAHRREVTARLLCAVETIGFSPAARWQVTHDVASRRVTLLRESEQVASWTLQPPGEHNAMNSAFAAALAIALGADARLVGLALSSFVGVDRRVQLLGHRPLRSGGSVRVYDDYGHHPTEIDATLRALRQREEPEKHGGRLICVFQPHQHSRTRFFLDEFAASFSQVDALIVPQIYFVRDSEMEKAKVQSSDLVDRLRSRGVRAMHLHPFEAIVEHLEQFCQDGDLLVVMGAGPVWKVAHAFMELAPDACPATLTATATPALTGVAQEQCGADASG